MAKLVAQFEIDRTQVGCIRLLKGDSTEVIMLSALSKAANDTARDNNNVGANPLYPYGDTPTGTYQILAVVNSGAGTIYSDVSKFGDVGVIKLEPLLGDALQAKVNGRTGLLIHGGSPGPSTLLRRTNGCIRMMNSDLAVLISSMQDLSIAGDPVATLEVVELIGVGRGNCEDNGTCDEGDPPPF